MCYRPMDLWIDGPAYWQILRACSGEGTSTKAALFKAYNCVWVGRGSDAMLFSLACYDYCLSWSVGHYLVKLADQRYPLPFFTWLSMGVRGNRELNPAGTKSCRTQGDFRSFSLIELVRPWQGLMESLWWHWGLLKSGFKVWGSWSD